MSFVVSYYYIITIITQHSVCQLICVILCSVVYVIRLILAEWWLRVCPCQVDDWNYDEKTGHFATSLCTNCQHILFTGQSALCRLIHWQWLPST